MQSKKSQVYYQGKLYATDTWPLSSVTWMIFQGCQHMHERGILHQACISLVRLSFDV